MTGTCRTSQGLDPRRKRLLFRSWHRGTREMDLIMGRFADDAVDSLTDGELGQFEALIEVPDRDLFAWIAGREDTPGNYDTSVFRRLQAFHLQSERAVQE
jgi:antitoxin CptB